MIWGARSGILWGTTSFQGRDVSSLFLEAAQALPFDEHAAKIDPAAETLPAEHAPLSQPSATRDAYSAYFNSAAQSPLECEQPVNFGNFGVPHSQEWNWNWELLERGDEQLMDGEMFESQPLAMKVCLNFIPRGVCGESVDIEVLFLAVARRILMSSASHVHL